MVSAMTRSIAPAGGSGGPQRLPHGPHGLSPEAVARSQRTRLIQAVSVSVAEKGYAATTLNEVIKHARVSRTTFYERFADKEDLFVAAYERSVRAHVRAIVEAFRQHDETLPALGAGARAYLQVLADEPAFTRAFIVEVRLAGRRALETHDRLMGMYAGLLGHVASLLDREHPGRAPISEPVLRAATAGVENLVEQTIIAGQGAELMDREPDMLHLILAVLGVPDAPATAINLARAADPT